MPTNVATLTAKITADTRGLKKGLGDAEREVSGFSRKASTGLSKLGPMVAAGAAAGAVAVGAFAAKSVAAFANFEQGMSEVFTLMPGMTEDAMRKMESDVQSFSREMGVATTEAVPALYQAISAGVPPDNVFDFMETATKASIAGVTDMETAVDGITSAVNAYGVEALNAEQASDMMFTAVKLGKTDFQQLSKSMFQVAPVASGVGVEFSNVTAALAALTSVGTPTKVAAVQLKGAMAELSKEGSIAFTNFEKATGTTFPNFIAEGGNLQEAFQALKLHADDTGTGVQNMFGSIEAGQAILALTSEEGAPKFAAALEEMGNSAGATETAFQTMDRTLKRSMDRIKAVIENAMIDVGRALEPVVRTIADWAEEALPKLMDAVVTTFEAMVPAIEGILPVVEDAVVAVGEIATSLEPVIEATGWLLDLRNAVADFGEAAQDSTNPFERFAGGITSFATSGALPNTIRMGQDYIQWLRDIREEYPKITEEEDRLRRENHRNWIRIFDKMDEAQEVFDTTTGEIGAALGAASIYSAEWAISAEEDFDSFVSAAEAWEQRTGQTLDDNIVAFDEWGNAMDDQTAAFRSRMDDTDASVAEHVGNIISVFDRAPEQIKISVDEMIEILLSTQQAAGRYETVMRELQEAGFWALARVLEERGPEYTWAMEQVMAEAASTGAGEANRVFEMDLDLQAGIIAAATGGKISAAQVGAEIGGMLARSVEASFNPSLPTPRPGVPTTPPPPPDVPTGVVRGGETIGFAEGGLIRKPTLGWIGEAGPEAIIPLNDVAGWLSRYSHLIPGFASGGVVAFGSGFIPAELAPDRYGFRPAARLPWQPEPWSTGTPTADILPDFGFGPVEPPAPRLPWPVDPWSTGTPTADILPPPDLGFGPVEPPAPRHPWQPDPWSTGTPISEIDLTPPPPSIFDRDPWSKGTPISEIDLEALKPWSISSLHRDLIGAAENAPPSGGVESYSRQGGHVTVIVNGNLFGATDVDELAELLEDARRNMRLRGGAMI